MDSPPIAADFERFFADHYAGVIRALHLALWDGHAAEDAAQEAFARAYRRWSTVATLDRPVAWVYVVAVRHARRAARLRSRSWPASHPVTPPADSAAAVDNACIVDSALAQLTPAQRAVVVLRFHADLSVRETAQATGKAEGTVKATLHQALTQLRVVLADSEEEPPCT